MKKYIYGMAIAASLFSLSSCLGDLDTQPLNETDKSAQQAYSTYEGFEKGLAYIYGSFSLVSQNDPGSSDISVDDAGQSDLMRQFVVLNEMSADALKCVWGDSYITDTQNATWTSTPNAATIAVYTRGMVTVTRANEFLKQSAGSSIEGVEKLRSEARLLRAYAYFMLMDLYGNPPFATEENIGGDLPKQLGRKALCEWIESELKELVADDNLADASAAVYPRVSKGLAQALLARLYLNSEVYTGTARWTEARDAAQAVISMGAYSLCPNYQQLFMQDNSENANARKEFVFAIAYDAEHTQTWGGTTHLVSGSMGDDAAQAVAEGLGYSTGSMISRERWNGYHVPDQYVAYFDLQDVSWGKKDAFGYNRETSDKRAMLTNYGNTQEWDKSSADTGWRCWKFSSRASDGSLRSTDAYTKFSSADFPVIRLAEMYLIYAEAQARLDGGQTTNATAMGYVKQLRDRAGVDMPSSLSLDFLLEENAREFMWEGHRRVDLIRYGYFTSMSFPWPYKNGVPNGKSAIPSYRTIYPILTTDLAENPNLSQNPGY